MKEQEYEQINHPNGVTTWKTKPKEQPDALRLADALNRAIQQEAPDDDVICVARWFVEDSATELRRLHALNQELLEALKGLSDWSEQLRVSGDAGYWNWSEGDEYMQACAAIAKAQGAINE